MLPSHAKRYWHSRMLPNICRTSAVPPGVYRCASPVPQPFGAPPCRQAYARPCREAYTRPCYQAYTQPCYQAYSACYQPFYMQCAQPFTQSCSTPFFTQCSTTFTSYCATAFTQSCYQPFVSSCYQPYISDVPSEDPCYERHAHPCYQEHAHPCYEAFAHPCYQPFSGAATSRSWPTPHPRVHPQILAMSGFSHTIALSGFSGTIASNDSAPSCFELFAYSLLLPVRFRPTRQPRGTPSRRPDPATSRPRMTPGWKKNNAMETQAEAIG